MPKNFTRQRPPDFHHGEETDMRLTLLTAVSQGAYRTVDVLPGETLADVTKRIYKVNSRLNRDRITANNAEIAGKLKVPNVR